MIEAMVMALCMHVAGGGGGGGGSVACLTMAEKH